MGDAAKENGHLQVGNHSSVASVPTAAPVLAKGNLATSVYFGGSPNLESRPKVGAFHVPGLCLLHSRGVTSSGAGEFKRRKNSKVL